MRSITRLGVQAESTASLSSRQSFVCASCRSKLRARTSRGPRLRASFSVTAPRSISFPSIPFLSKKDQEAETELGEQRTYVDKDSLDADSEYTPANTWDGLEWVGSPTWNKLQKAVPVNEKRLAFRNKSTALDLRQAIQQAIVEEYSSSRPDNLSQKQVLDTLTSSSPESVEWSEVSLGGPDAKFRIIRNVSSITGQLIPDNVINSCSNARALYSMVRRLQQPKPPKVAEALAANGQLNALGNVTVHAKRLPSSHKDRQVGRWKVIEEELAQRGLLEDTRP